jgi:hypothetical protein
MLLVPAVARYTVDPEVAKSTKPMACVSVHWLGTVVVWGQEVGELAPPPT